MDSNLGLASTKEALKGACRFCDTNNNIDVTAEYVCDTTECQTRAKQVCTEVLPCGHACGGIWSEDPCLPCLQQGCSGGDESIKQYADDICVICFTEPLSAAPVIRLQCNHLLHLHCTKNILEKRWVGPRITFGFSLCPICKVPIDHPALEELLKPIQDLYEDVKRKAKMRLEHDDAHMAEEAVSSPGSPYFNDLAGFAMDKYAYYVCYKCNKPYYGGEARCDEQVDADDDYDPEELVCGGCSETPSAQECPKHGTDFLEYKCRYCCSVALYYCFGTTHFCDTCHNLNGRVCAMKELPHCPAGAGGQQLEGDECPLYVRHPPTGEEFVLGCGICRDICRTF